MGSTGLHCTFGTMASLFQQHGIVESVSCRMLAREGAADTKPWPITLAAHVKSATAHSLGKIAVWANNNKLTHISSRLARELNLEYNVRKKILVRDHVYTNKVYAVWQCDDPIFISVLKNDLVMEQLGDTYGPSNRGGPYQATCCVYPFVVKHAHWDITVGHDFTAQVFNKGCVMIARSELNRRPSIGPNYEKGTSWMGHNMSFVESCDETCNFIVELYVEGSTFWQRAAVNVASGQLFAQFKG